MNELATAQDWNQFLNKKNPSVPFSRATLNDWGSFTTLPVDFATSSPSHLLCETLNKIKRVWVFNNENACRIIINAIFTAVLWHETNERLLGFCEVQNDWHGPGFGFTGNADYIFGSSKIRSVDSLDPFLLVVIANKEWPDSAIPQVLAQASCLLKKPLAAGKETPVFAVLTNGIDFRFFVIDTDRVVYASKRLVLEKGEDLSYNSSTSLPEILRWFTWFMVAIQSISPSASSEHLPVEKIEDSLTQLRNCFGPKSSKKLKIQKFDTRPVCT